MSTLTRYTTKDIPTILDSLYNLDDWVTKIKTYPSSMPSNYPPYNVVKLDSNNVMIEMAVSGFKREDLEVTTEKNILTVSSSKEEDTREYMFRGLAKRSFKKSWELSDDSVVDKVTCEDGILSIHITQVVPKEKMKRVYDIN
jgi:molecular chaperone IbpA